MPCNCPHAIYSFYEEINSFSGRWRKVVSGMWTKVNGSNMPDLIRTLEPPKDLTLAMQEPLITPWWTIGCLAALASKYLLFFLTMAKAVRNHKQLFKKILDLDKNIFHL
jgi:hypothetical protein